MASLPSATVAPLPGRTSVSSAAVAKIVRTAAQEVAGVSTLTPQDLRVIVGETQVAVDIELVAWYGASLRSLADQVRNAVYRAVQHIVGMQVTEVNVGIGRVQLPEQLIRDEDEAERHQAAIAPPAPATSAPESQEQTGHNRITSEALSTLAQGAVAEIFSVSPQDIRVRLWDEAGELAVSVATPIAAPGLDEVLRDRSRVKGSGGSVWQRTLAAKSYVQGRLHELSGSEISRVDIRITAVRPAVQRRVQ